MLFYCSGLILSILAGIFAFSQLLNNSSLCKDAHSKIRAFALLEILPTITSRV